MPFELILGAIMQLITMFLVWSCASDGDTFCCGYISWCIITLLWSLTSANFHRHSKRPDAWILNEKNHFSMDTGRFIFFIYLWFCINIFIASILGLWKM